MTQLTAGLLYGKRKILEQIFLVACALVLVFGFAQAARANLVTNGGFETGDFTGWTLGNTPGGFLVVLSFSPTVGISGVYEGSYSAWLGAMFTDDTLSQTLTTTPGQTYEVSWDFASDGAIPNNFFASFAGDTLFSASHIAKQGWTEYTFDVTASSSSSVLTFSSMDTPGYLGLDNVSVDPVPTPEPCSLLLIGFGLAGLMVLNRKLRDPTSDHTKIKNRELHALDSIY